MKKLIGYAALAALGFLTLCFMFPGKGEHQSAELCGDGKELVASAGASEDEARRLVCDHKAAQEGVDALDVRQHGS